MEDQAPETEVETVETETVFDMQSIDRKYFPPNDMENAGLEINRIVEGAGEDNVVFNFDPNDAETISDGFGLCIVPNTRREAGKGTVTYGVTVAAIPDPTTVLAHEKGEEFLRSLCIDSLVAKIANSARVRPDGSSGTLPTTITDFMERRSSKGEGLKTYTELSSHFVKALRKKGLKLINAQLLRSCLQSATFAEEQFEKITQEQWVQVLDLMIAKAGDDNLDPAILNDWKDKRDQFEIETVDEVDFNDLGDLV
jgi:hypothetical protein